MKQTLPLKVKLSYGVGDLGTNLVVQSVNLFVMFFMTDVFGINPIAAGTIFLVANLWDAVWDTIMGVLVDKTRTRFGQKRPYLLFGAIPFGLSFALLFFAPQLNSETAKIAWMFVFFVLFRTSMSLVNVPYAALTVSLTSDTEERTRLTGVRMTFAIVGLLLAGVAFKPLSEMLGGFRIVSIIFGAVVVVCTLIPFFGVKEAHREEGSGHSIFKNLKAVFANPPFLVLVLASFFFMITTNLLAAVVPFFFKHVLNADDKSFIGLGVLFVSALLYLYPLTKLTIKFGKKAVYIVAMIILALSLVFIGFFVRDWLTTVIVFLFSGIGISAIFLMPWSIVADTIEYSEYKSGVRPEGALYGFFLFATKIAAAIAIWLNGFVLGSTHYLETLDPKHPPIQPESAIQGIVFQIGFLPAAIIALGVFVMFYYKLGKKEHEALLVEIQKRKS